MITGNGFSKSSRLAASLTSIAAAADVSVSTVSKVLNGRSDVAPETRERLGRILRLHGYQVAPPAGIGVVDLLIGSLGSPWADELIRGAVTAAAETETSVIVSHVTSAAEFGRWLKIATARGTRGVLSVLHPPDSAAIRPLAGGRVPLVVVIDPPAEPGGSIRSVGTTNWQGGVTAARHLIELDHQRIAAIGGPDEAMVLPGRGSTATAAPCAGPGSSTTPWSAATICPPTAACARRGHSCPAPDAPTAIVAGNDAQAFGVLQALAERGRRCPDDLSVTGFNDLPIATWATPPLTTIRQPLAAMAATAFWMLTSSDAEVQPRHLELETTLVVRRSTAPPR